jgi:hypothetical protein
MVNKLNLNWNSIRILATLLIWVSYNVSKCFERVSSDSDTDSFVVIRVLPESFLPYRRACWKYKTVFHKVTFSRYGASSKMFWRENMHMILEV